MLSLRGVNQFYGESHTLWDIDLEVPEGSCTCLMGRNGVGKTTLLKSVMGLLPLKSGDVRFGELDLAPQRPEMRARKGIGYVPQGREIFGQLSVAENLRVGLSARPDRATKVPERVFELFPVLKNMMKRRGGDLSGGQQQQLAMGRALALDPKLLILDEPTEGIQPNIVAQIGDVLHKLNKEFGLTILIVEQRLAFARKVADRFCILDRGRVVASGKMDDLDESMVEKHLKV
jgi:urea transport system ATP-binding protein